MGREREDVRAAMELLLTPKQYAFIMGCRGRSRIQTLRILVQDGMRYHAADPAVRELYLERAREWMELYGEEDRL